MTSPGFMDGFTNELPGPIGWKKGQYLIEMPVICCPQCGSVQVARRDNGEGSSYITWECSMCRYRFRLPRGIGLKAYLHA
jgi:hypothetical protein